jgi:hypothetical protein
MRSCRIGDSPPVGRHVGHDRRGVRRYGLVDGRTVRGCAGLCAASPGHAGRDHRGRAAPDRARSVRRTTRHGSIADPDVFAGAGDRGPVVSPPRTSAWRSMYGRGRTTNSSILAGHTPCFANPQRHLEYSRGWPLRGAPVLPGDRRIAVRLIQLHDPRYVTLRARQHPHAAGGTHCHTAGGTQYPAPHGPGPCQPPFQPPFQSPSSQSQSPPWPWP